LRSYHLEPDLVPPEYRSESLATVLAQRAAGKRLLLARADRGRELLREELAAVADVEQVAVYSQVDCVEPDPAILEQLRQGKIDYITLTSSNIARALVRALDAPALAPIKAGVTKLVSISPVTSATVRDIGLPVAAEAVEFTVAGLVEALLEAARRG
jgi:uroporphyrinogen III methyltransferase/synthase